MRARLLKGADGVFDVRVDGELIFSKDEADRFPEPDEILKQLRSSQSAG